jgi:hypothetical protein
MIVVADRLKRDAKPKTRKIVQAIVLLCLVGCFLLTTYSLFEAYWSAEVLECSKFHWCSWVSYQDSPGMFVFVVIFDAFLFLLFGFAIGASYRLIFGKQDGQRD